MMKEPWFVKNYLVSINKKEELITMTGKEMKQVVDELKAEGNSNEEILGACYDLYKDGQFNEQDLNVVASFLGYELKPEFFQMSEEERKSIKEEDFADDEVQKENGGNDNAGGESAPKEMPKQDNNDNNPKGENETPKEEPKEENEDEERARVRKELFGFDN